VERVTAGHSALPSVLVPVRDRLPASLEQGDGILFHDLSLIELIHLSATVEQPTAVDLDTVEGLAADATALAFLVERLGIRIVITRRPALALRGRELGCQALLRVHCLDSTGLDRALDGHPGPPVGTAVSPGLILAHLALGERRRLPPPVLAYGLMRRQEDLDAAWAAGAAAVVTNAPPHAGSA
jgi:glycerol-3-phosphate responsive antiterminator